MSVKASIRFLRFGEIKLIQSVHFDGEELPRFFSPPDQLVCRHPACINKIVPFKKFTNKRFTIPFEDFKLFYQSRSTLTESDYRARFSTPSPSATILYNKHSETCSICRHWHARKPQLNKRKKLSDNDKLQLALRIGKNYSLRNLAKHFKTTETTILQFKRKLLANKITHKRPKTHRKTSSLTAYQQSQIVQEVCRNEFVTSTELKIIFKLSCDSSTIRKFLKSVDLSSFKADERLLISSRNLDLQRRFIELLRFASQSDFDNVIFCDEKTLTNSIIGPVRVRRARRPRHFRRNLRNHRFQIRRNPLTCTKVNLFGFVTRQSVGETFVIPDKVNSAKFISIFEKDILPSIIARASPGFILLLDNATYHTSNLTFEYFHRINLKVLIYPPQFPQLNIIENLWSVLQKRVNKLHFTEGIVNRKEDLAKRSFQAWNSIEDSIVTNLYNSIPSRLLELRRELYH